MDLHFPVDNNLKRISIEKKIELIIANTQQIHDK